MKALAKRPSERYRSAEEFSAALTEVRRQIDPSSTGQHTMVLGAVAGEAAAQTTLMAASPPRRSPRPRRRCPPVRGRATAGQQEAQPHDRHRDRAHRGARHRRRGGRAADLARRRIRQRRHRPDRHPRPDGDRGAGRAHRARAQVDHQRRPEFGCQQGPRRQYRSGRRPVGQEGQHRHDQRRERAEDDDGAQRRRASPNPRPRRSCRMPGSRWSS